MTSSAENFPVAREDSPIADPTLTDPTPRPFYQRALRAGAVASVALLAACGPAEVDTTEQNYQDLSAAIAETAKEREAHFGERAAPLKLPEGWGWKTLSYAELEDEVDSHNHISNERWDDNPVSLWMDEAAKAGGADTLRWANASSLEAPDDLAVVWMTGQTAHTEDRQKDNRDVYHLAKEEKYAAAAICAGASATLRHDDPGFYYGDELSKFAEAQVEEEPRGFWEGGSDTDDINRKFAQLGVPGGPVPQANDFESPHSVLAMYECGSRVLERVNARRADYGPSSWPIDMKFFIPVPPKE